MLTRKRTSLLDEICVIYEQLFQQVQCTVRKVFQSNSIDLFVLPRAFDNLSNSNRFPYRGATNWIDNGKQQNSTSLCQL